MRLGMFGGTFNPIHMGHLVLAETAREALRLDRVLFIPTGQPPHKPASHLPPGMIRLKLIQLAIRDHSNFASSDIEVQRDGPSYTIDTVKLIRTQLPEAKLFLLMGQDMLGVQWLGWNELKRLCTIVVAHRPGSKTTRREAGVVWLPMPRLDISSLDIRARVKAGTSIRYLVPAAVERYLRQHRLYARGGEGR